MQTIKQMMKDHSIKPIWNSSVIGIEKEGLRVKKDGTLATTPHPITLGSRSFHPYIQTDFSDVQLELITPPLTGAKSINQWLPALHDVTYHSMNDEEWIWPLSMPGSLPEEKDIPIARLEKRADVVYREYLAKVYGKKKQMQSGIHINFEFDTAILNALYEKQTDITSKEDFQSAVYMKLARNFLRYRWMLSYLFGASPTVMENFYPSDVAVPEHYARSLRNSHLGYTNDEEVIVSYESLEAYVESIQTLVFSGALSEEREFYSPIRLRGTKQVKDMLNKGIAYVELRNFDLNPFTSFSITEQDLVFVKMFCYLMIWLDEETTAVTSKTGDEKNHLTSVEHPKAVSQFKEEGLALLEEMQQMAVHSGYEKAEAAVAWAKELFEYPEKTLSAQIMDGIEAEGDYIAFGMKLAQQYKQEAMEKPYQLRGFTSLEMSTQLLIHDALQTGITVDVIDEHDQFVKLSYGNHIEYVKNGNMTSKDTYISSLIMANKTVTKKILAENGFHVPGGGEYQTAEEAQNDFWRYQNKAIVVKPKSTNYGIGISIFKNGPTQEDFNQAIKIAFKEDSSVLVEEYIVGTEYRFFVVNDHVPAVLLRTPANVIGNGTATVKELVDEKNQDPLRGTHHRAPLEKIVLGEIEQLMLKEQGYSTESIPEKGTVVYLRENSNISTGGDSIDVTDEMHDSYKELAVKMAEAIEANVTGIDLIIPDLTQPSTIQSPGYTVIEANFNPAMHMHAYVYKGKNRRLTKEILIMLFPELTKTIKGE